MRSIENKITEIELQLDSFMLYCDSKQLSPKTLKSYQQTLTLFINFLKQELKMEDASMVKSSHIRYYINYLRERGKYTITATEKIIKY